MHCNSSVQEKTTRAAFLGKGRVSRRRRAATTAASTSRWPYPGSARHGTQCSKKRHKTDLLGQSNSASSYFIFKSTALTGTKWYGGKSKNLLPGGGQMTAGRLRRMRPPRVMQAGVPISPPTVTLRSVSMARDRSQLIGDDAYQARTGSLRQSESASSGRPSASR